MKKLLYTLIFAFSGVSVYAQDNTSAKPINISSADYVEFSPTVSGDGKTMVFQSNREGGYRLYESTLIGENTWSEPKSIEAINRLGKPNYLIGGPCLSYDGKILYFCAMFAGSLTDMDIYISKKNNKNEWSTPDNIGRPITTTASETFPSISPDGKTLFYTVTKVAGMDDKCSKIMMSKQDERGNWTKPAEVAAPINATCDKAPRMLYDNKTLVFANSANGHYDIFQTELNNETNNWSQPLALEYMNSPEAELYASLSSMEDYMYYSKKGDIYYAPIPAKFKLHGVGLEGTVVDEETGKAVAGKMYLVDSLSKDTIKRMDVNGAYGGMHVPATGKIYKLVVTADRYYPYITTYAASVTEKYTPVTAPIKLKYKKKEVVFNVADKESSKGLKVKIKVTNVDTKEEIIVDAGSGRDGKYAVSLREGNKYNVEISSIEGYAFSTTVLEVPITSDAVSIIPSDTTKTVEQELPNFDIKLQPLKDNTQLTLNDIYFQFNKFQLEEASYVELERVVNLMRSNPSAKIEIAAHTDDVGSDEFNNALSLKRAMEIVKYLKTKGISSSRLIPKGYGKTKPIDPANTEEARAKNRRVELHILDIK